MKKILVISDWAPPMIDGPSLILGNLLREFENGRIILFCRKINRNTSIYKKEGNVLNAKRYSVFVPSPYIPGLGSFSRKLYRLIEISWVPITVVRALIVCIKQKIDCIVTTSDAPHIHFLTTAHCLSKITNKKLVLYLLDPVEEFKMGRIQKILVNAIMPRALRRASSVIVMSDILAEYYNRRYGVRCEVLPHPMNVEDNTESRDVDKTTEQEINVVFSGKVSRYQADSLINLRKAINAIPRKFRIRLYTSTGCDYLKKYGFDGKDVIVEHLAHDKMKEELKNADILFLPLSFEYSGSMVVKAAFPAKTMDYLLASRPILINAPEDSFIVKYATKDNWAICVTENSANALASAIRVLISDKDKRMMLINNCKKVLKQHDSKIIYKRFAEIICGAH